MLTDDQLDELDSSREYSYPRTVKNFIKALEILRTLAKKEEYLLQGEHDEIYVFAGPPTSDEQQIELDKLGFRFDEDLESWRIYT
jgi:hypothetical protein